MIHERLTLGAAFAPGSAHDSEAITMHSAIIGVHLDAQGDRIAEPACGHFQHVRHDPPWTNRP